MSRRDSRLSLNVRQNDALNEFENFKKKFLLANKHITKLNSTLSVRIEELNAQISTLYVENLRLRASEIALTAQLKKEQEKSRKIMAGAEAATANLVKHLTFLRQSFGIAPGVASPPKEAKQAPRARRPLVDSNASPQMPKLSRAPNVPGIYEEEEVASSPEGDEEEAERIPSPTIRRKVKSRLAASRLPLPARVSSPPPLPTPPQAPPEERGPSSKRKAGRRESGLLNVSTDGGDRIIPPRAASPAFGSPARREAGLAEDDEEQEIVRKSRLPPAQDEDYVPTAKKEREKKMKQVEREIPSEEGEAAASSRVRERKRRRHEDYSGLKDVTNSPRSRAMLPPLDTNASDRDRQHTPDTDGTTPISAVASLATTRSFLSTPATTPATTTSQISQLPTPRASSSPVPPPCASTSELEASAVGRERRTRKSVNYTEPKLNTKMRKPDAPPTQPTAAAALKKRSSTTSVQDEDPERRPSLEGFSQSKTSIPDSRSSSGTSSSSSAAAPAVVKRKKSRPYVEVDDDESEGAQADAEYGNINGWVNVEGRRRSVQHSAARRALEADDGRRHSLAV
ncbi:uncharacterized protein EDB91DRAFT_730277 [Suillus paluster]|uniref:uncharacterized protein n=1 Tax=Suillus paluster TaxID=48578 RepID=UPI001B864698|nr:uncharacterized protein EDB91DRAFT_730277 [Suillus paluster]KAG1731202.1 hypothetical protein EDB91DRAFT_730277 [Suillus paluster]